MPSVSRRLRIVLGLVVTSLAGALLLAGRGGSPPQEVASARTTGPVLLAADLDRAPWFHMGVLTDPTTFTASAPAAKPPDIPAAGGILVDIDTDRILWQQNAHAQLPPASTTKILAAMVALENFNASRPVNVTLSALQQAPDESVMGIAAGEQYTVQELLTGMVLVSGNDAATALAEDTVGIERFVAAMNAQVAALGLHDSHFTTPVGLQDPQQHSSAYDLAAISAAAVRHFPLFGKIVAMQDATLPATSGHPEFDLHSINLLLSLYPYAVGIKPGWTGDAGYCEVGMAVRDGHRLISVLLDAPYDFHQSARLLDWGFVQEGLPTTLPTPSPSPVHAHG